MAASKITITVPAQIGARIALVCASYTTDLAGAFDCQDNTTSVFQVKTEARSATFAQPAFTPCQPIPINTSVNTQALFILNVTTTGRLSVVYGYVV